MTIQHCSPTESKRRIVVVEDYPIVREGLVQLLNSSNEFEVQDAFACPGEAREGILRLKPEAVLMDLMLGGNDGVSLVSDLMIQIPDLKILVFSGMSESVYAERVLRAGAVGYLMKTAKPTEILHALRTVLSGNLYLSPKLAVPLVRGLIKRTGPNQLPGAEGLSDRELQVFQLIGTGLPNREIASQLNISVKTVETFREKIKIKLGFRDSTALVAAAVAFVASIIA